MVHVKSNAFRFLNKFWFYVFSVIAIFLGWLGGNPVEHPYLQIGQFFTIAYFIYFILLINLISFLD